MISNYEIHFDEHLENENLPTSEEIEIMELMRADDYCDELGIFE